MSSSMKTNHVGAKILCIALVISIMGTRSAVNAGVVIAGSSLTNNRPSSLVSAATGLYMAQLNGQNTHSQGYQQGLQLIQANKDKVNLAIVSQIG